MRDNNVLKNTLKLLQSPTFAWYNNFRSSTSSPMVHGTSQGLSSRIAPTFMTQSLPEAKMKKKQMLNPVTVVHQVRVPMLGMQGTPVTTALPLPSVRPRKQSSQVQKRGRVCELLSLSLHSRATHVAASGDSTGSASPPETGCWLVHCRCNSDGLGPLWPAPPAH